MSVTCQDYAQVQKLLFSIIHKHRRKYGGSFDDLLSQAHVHYLRAMELWDPNKGKKSTWIHWVVSHCLLESVRTQAIKNSRLKQHNTIDLAYFSVNPRFDFDKVLTQVSKDAQTVLKVVTSQPLDYLQVSPTSSGKTKKKALINFLFDLGWAGQRIVESFQEIREVLFS